VRSRQPCLWLFDREAKKTFASKIKLYLNPIGIFQQREQGK